MMGTLPVDMVTDQTNMKLLKVPRGRGKESVLDLFLFDRLEWAVAVCAPLKGTDRFKKIKSLQDLEQLFPGVRVSYAVTMGHDITLQDSTVS